MSISITSRAAYSDLNRNGKSESQKQMILGALEAVGAPLSGREIMKCTGLEINAISGRINDLKKSLHVIECARRKCSISNTLITPVTINNDCECSRSEDDICTGRC